MAPNGRGSILAESDFTARLKEIPQDLTQIIKQDIELAKAEMAEKVDRVRSEVDKARADTQSELEAIKAEAQQLGRTAGIGAGLVGAAGLVGLAAFATFTVVLVSALALALPLWAAALIVTAVYGALGAALALAGKTKFKQVGERIPQTTQQLDQVKSVAGSTFRRIKQEVPVAPELTLKSIKDSKEELTAAWHRGSHANGSRPHDGAPG